MRDRSTDPSKGTGAADEKIMATSPDDKAGRTVEATQTTVDNTANSHIESYYVFPASDVKAVDTYSGRIGDISKALGNKDTAKG